jgi:hypothetical protein
MGFKFIPLLLINIFFFHVSLLSQNYPAYHVNIADSSSSGYYFLAPIKTGRNVKNPPAMLILDKAGNVIYYKTLKQTDAVLDFKIQPNGMMSYFSKDRFYLMDSTFSIIDSIKCLNGVSTDVHDFQVLKNGNYLLMGIEYIRMDLSQYKFFNRNGSPGSTYANVLCGVIQELDKNKNLVFEWHARDHFSFDDVDPFYLNSPDGVDWNHFNGIELDTDGNILLSQRHFNEITKINHKDSSIIWRWGGKKNTFAFLNDSARFIGQHDIRRLPNGHLTLLDNGRAGKPTHPVAAKEYKLDEIGRTASLVWSYIRDTGAVSSGTGNVQRLPNGTTLVDYGLLSKNRQVFDIVDSARNNLFGLGFIDSFISYRAFNYDHLPWQLKRLEITCNETGGKYYLGAGGGHSTYRWSNGDTSQLTEITKADTLFVFVPFGDGGYIRSESFIVSNHTDPCGFTRIQQNNPFETFEVFPNPVHDYLVIKCDNMTGKSTFCEISNITGQKMISQNMFPVSETLILPVNHLPAGVYFINLNGARQPFIKE